MREREKEKKRRKREGDRERERERCQGVNQQVQSRMDSVCLTRVTGNYIGMR